ncbi:protein JINGUBANG-like [Salvia hispanica]|uniref:protein JINGUBANG-like n=1 Tax=Salvia hispanica TaxID=49212 RepID=UPI0020099CF3|nr:protein JINGUBANG-like [Salvia hispanica]
MDTVSSIHFPPSFLMRGQTLKFPRSASSKEAPRSDPTLALPPRLSSASLHHHSHSSTPRLSFTTPKLDADAASHRCISSVLRKDGQILCIAAANGLIYTGSQASTVRVWKMPEFTECGHLKTKACMVVALQVSNDRVFAAYADCKIRVWRRTCEGDVKHARIATVPAPGSFLRGYISGHDKTSKHLGPISSLAINTNDDVLYSASLDKTVKVWRISDFKCIETIQAHLEPINALALAAADGALYTASDDATVRVWRRGGLSSGPRSHSLTVTLPTKHSPAKALALAADGGVLYAGCTDGYVHYWLKGCFSGQLQHGGALPGHTHAVMCLASAGTFLATGSADSTSRVWAREADGSHSCVAVLQGHRGPVRCVAAFPYEKRKKILILSQQYRNKFEKSNTTFFLYK